MPFGAVGEDIIFLQKTKALTRFIHRTRVKKRLYRNYITEKTVCDFEKSCEERIRAEDIRPNKNKLKERKNKKTKRSKRSKQKERKLKL